jgi:hypothetical protein
LPTPILTAAKFEKEMKVYDDEAIDLARKLYCKYAGKNFPAIEAEMQKVYPGWSKQNLIDRGKGKAVRFGWITRYGFDNALKIHMQKLTESVNDDEQDLYLGIKTSRKELQKKVVGAKPTRDELYQYRDFCKLEIEARRNLDLSRDNLETFVAGYEKLLGWLSGIDKKAAVMLIKHGEKLAELAAAHYGKPEEVVDGAGDREDEGGE